MKKGYKILSVILAISILLGTVPFLVFANESGNGNADSASEDSVLAVTNDNEEIPDFNVWMADTMISGIDKTGDGLYKTYRDFQNPVYEQLGGYLVEDELLISLSASWSVFLNSEYRAQFCDEKKYIYEILIMDYLKYGTSDSNGAKVDLNNNYIKFATALWKNVAGEVAKHPEKYSGGEMSYEQMFDYMDTNLELKSYKDALKVVGKTVSSAKALGEAVANYRALQQVKEEKIILLNEAKKYCQSMETPNTDFIRALDDIMNTFKAGEVVYYADKTRDFLWTQMCDELWKALGEVNPVFQGIDLGVSGLNALFDTSNQAANNLKLTLLYTLNAYMECAMTNASGDFIANNTSENAEIFMACFEGYVEFQMYGNSFANGWLEDYLASGVVADCFNRLFEQDNIQTAQELIELSNSQISTRERLLELINSYAEIYKGRYGEDIGGGEIDSGQCGDNVYWTLYDSGLLDIYGSGSMWNYIQNCSPWYKDTRVKEVQISNSITTVGNNAFDGCTNMVSANIGNSIIEIGECAFDGCTSLLEINIPNSVTSIGSCAFLWCKNLRHITLSKNVSHLDEDAFDHCSNLMSICVDKDNEYYCSDEQGVLYSKNQEILVRCPEAKEKVSIPDSVRKIGNGAFEYCCSLTTICMSNNITSIGWHAFECCTSLTTIGIPKSVTIICPYAFNQCENLIYIVLPDNLTKIEDATFAGCKNLEQVAIQNSVTDIGDYAFGSCNKLKEVTIPESVKSIGIQAFGYYYDNNDRTNKKTSNYKIYGTKGTVAETYANENGFNFVSVAEIVASGKCGDNVYWTLYEGGLLNICGSGDMYNYNYIQGEAPWHGDTRIKTLQISDGITTVGSEAFEYCTRLTSISIPDSVTSIEASAFSCCVRLTSIVLPDSLIKLGVGSFSSVSGLTSIVIPYGITSIETATFAGCERLTSITIPNSVTSIGAYAFQSCKLTSIIIPNSVTSIGDYAFRCCENLTSIIIPSAMIRIGKYAFDHCNIRVITIPDSVTSIGNYAFGYNCEEYNDCKIPGFTIYSTKGSVAEIYANNNGFTFIAIEKEIQPTDESSYTVNKDKGYISHISEKATKADFLNNFSNSNIEVYNANGEVLSDSDNVGTGCVVKLTSNGSVVSTATVVVTGDVDGNGEIDIFDVFGILDHINNKTVLTGAKEKATLVDSEDEANIFDVFAVLDYINGKRTIEPRAI